MSVTIRQQAARIVYDVIRGGDRALYRWRWRLDRDRGPIELSARDIQRACDSVPRDVRASIRRAIRNVARVSRAQMPRPSSVVVERGVRIDLRVDPLARVACYVPGGRYPLPSTAIMTVTPASVAGVKEIVVTSPSPDPTICFAAVESGATQILRLGGAHAIAALAAGTETLPRVDKIVGPGNAWVAAAKDLVAFEGLCAIDMHAGPSEIVVWSNRAPAAWIAADLRAQAEHDPLARAILVTTSRQLAREVRRLVGPSDQFTIVVSRSRAAAIGEIQRLAPEHLVCDSLRDADACRAFAGTVFVGLWSAQAAGDYCTGSNHVLPTGRAARFRGGLSAADFVRTVTVQRITRAGLQRIGPSAIVLARAEGLHAHAESLRLRLEERS